MRRVLCASVWDTEGCDKVASVFGDLSLEHDMVATRIWFKLLVLPYHAVKGSGPSYIQDTLHHSLMTTVTGLIPTLYYEGGQATTKQYCDCLLFWLHIGKASSPFTSGQQKLCTSSIMDQKLISLNCTHYQKQNKTNILSFLLFINAALEAVQQIW